MMPPQAAKTVIVNRKAVRTYSCTRSLERSSDADRRILERALDIAAGEKAQLQVLMRAWSVPPPEVLTALLAIVRHFLLNLRRSL